MFPPFSLFFKVTKKGVMTKFCHNPFSRLKVVPEVDHFGNNL
ncbi:hypothetical protein CU017_0166 [Enterococcus lactis]|nr:hypothetical protein [Enterococcus lactis]